MKLLKQRYHDTHGACVAGTLKPCYRAFFEAPACFVHFGLLAEKFGIAHSIGSVRVLYPKLCAMLTYSRARGRRHSSARQQALQRACGRPARAYFVRAPVNQARRMAGSRLDRCKLSAGSSAVTALEV